MELDQEVRAFFTNDEQVEAKRLQLYVSRQSFKDTIDFSFMFFNRKTSSSAKSILVSQSKFVYLSSLFLSILILENGPITPTTTVSTSV